MALTVEELVIQLSAKTDNVTAQLSKVNAQLDQVGTHAQKASSQASAGFRGFGGVLTA